MANFSPLLSTLILLVFAKSTIEADDDLQCPNSYISTSTVMRLKRQIFCQYDKWIRPVKHQNDTVDVQIRLFVKRVDFNDRTDILTVQSLFIVRWCDYHVVWKPSEFDNVDYIRIHSWYLWNPDLGILNSVDKSAFVPNLNTEHCLVYSSGDIVCAPPVTQSASCLADIRYWPYDVHTCYLRIGSWMNSGEKLNLTTSNTPVGLKDFNMNREWDVSEVGGFVTVSTYGMNITYPYVTYKFTLERRSGSHVASVVIPAAVLTLVTLMSYWMESCHSERLYLATLSIFAHFTFLQYIGFRLPSNGDMTPVIVTFYRDSLVLTFMALIITIIIRGLRSSSKPVPLWAAGVSSWVLQSRIGQIIVLHKLDPKAVAASSESSSGEGADLVNSSERISEFEWNTFTSLLNFISFTITILTYFILFVGYLP